MRTHNVVRPWLEKRTSAVKTAVAKEFGVTVAKIDHEDRRPPLPTVRHAAMMICRELLKATYPEISILFNRKNHGSAMHACRATERRLEESKEFRERYDRASDAARASLRNLQAAAA